jgi:hypothetical protein
MPGASTWPWVVLCALISVASGGAAAVAALGLHQSPSSVYVLGYLILGGLAALVVVLAGAVALYTWLEAPLRRTHSSDARTAN